MSSEYDKQMDEELRAAWRAAAGDRTPPELDGEILRQAEAAAHRPAPGMPAWTRPLAYAATVVLGAFIVLNVPSPQQGQDAAEPAAVPAEALGAAPGEKRDRAPRLHEYAAERAAGSMPSAESKGLPAAQAPAASDSSRADLDTARQRFERSADAAESALEGFATTAPASLGAGRREAAKEDRAAAAAAADSALPSCEDARRASPETWWRCAQSLRDAGESEAARREFDGLYRLHPDFRPPE